MGYRVVATDLDGTIVRSDGTISARSKQALTAAEDGGAAVVIVTGRPPRWLTGIADATGHHGLAVCANGAVVYDLATEQIVRTRPMSVAVARELVHMLRSAIPGLGFAVEHPSGDFLREADYRPRVEQTPVADLDQMLSGPLLKLLARHEDLDADALLAAARDVVGAELATLTHSSASGLLEISAAGVSKATTLAALVAEHGATADDVVAFGDMPNDVPMLTWAGHAVAVANAHPEVLDVVDEVTASNDDDGVAVVLERLFG